MIKLPKRFQKSLNKKGKQMWGGLQFIKENFPYGARNIGQRAKEFMLPKNKMADISKRLQAETKARLSPEEIKTRIRNLEKIKEAHKSYWR